MNSLKNSRGKILVLIIDLDNDLGRIGINTPIIGYENVLNTAIKMGVSDPSDPDLNAMFQALRIYHDLRNNGKDVEIAVVTGEYGNLAASTIKIHDVLIGIRHNIGFEYIYFVSDGAYDEQVIPVIQSVGNIIGVSRVVVTQSKNIEETYILIGRYLKKALTEQPYSKFFLGIPGLLLILYVLVTVMGYAKYLWEVVSLLIGVILFTKGFGFIDRVITYWKTTPVLGLIYGSALVLLTYSITISIVTSLIYGFTITALKLVINTVFPIFVIGLISLVTSRIFHRVINGYAYMVWRDALLLIPIVFFIMFVNNLYQRIVRIEDSTSSEELITTIFKQDVFTPLVLTLISTIVFSLVFVVLDYIILKKSTSKSTLS